jgi:hypothetical protein
MSWIRSSKGALLGVLLVVSLVAVGTAAAVTVSADAPGEAQVGQDVSMSITIEEPFADAPDQWTLGGDTELENASWTVTTLEQGRTIETNEYGSSSFQQDLNIDSGTTDIEITVEGTAPELTEFNYDDREVEEFNVATISRVTNGNANELQSWDAHRYTEKSKEARQAIAEAEAAVANVSNEDARNLLDDAKAFYSNEEFDRAISNAGDAQEQAEQAAGGLPLVPIIGVVVVVVLVVAGVLYYRSQQQSDYKLQ